MLWENELDKFLEHNYPECCMVSVGPDKWEYRRPDDLFEIIRKQHDIIRTGCYDKCLSIIKNCQSTIHDEPNTSYGLAENERIYAFIANIK